MTLSKLILQLRVGAASPEIDEGESTAVAPPVKPVPLAWDAWRHLAFHGVPKPVGPSVPIPPEALPALLPGYPRQTAAPTHLGLR
ncbi:hypothetical protein F6X54_00025 [Micromonospora aurantiaca]|uniref:Uncharacterized protein n=1 Tax=Micromonospora aurantiaca (nom. illeg.) TaxID=47850 RepID=A0ABQ6UP26_9ACTN|nr:hypothetical protein F6X54_00025 [Micromonospora aurantiaca]